MKTVPTARLCDTEAEKNARLRRGSKLRAIDKGTCYDIPGKLRRVVHEIESGKHGEVTDVILAIRCVRKNSRVALTSIFTGKSQPEILHYMATYLVKEMQP
ncbi:MAG: hypothetical protein WBQ94_04265 [Terracidiphilus sp.]